MKPSTLRSFLLGVTCGIGVTVLALYTQKPAALVTSLGEIAEKGRMRRAKQREARWQREKLKAVGFTDEEIEDYFK